MSPEPKKQYDRYINRDLSWLKFNARVLQEANDASVPLIERLRFLGIFSNNLDEFFKVRYAAIKRIVDAGKVGRSELGGMSAIELQESITQTVIAQQQQSLDILGAIEHELAKEGVHVINETQITPAQSEFIIDYFLREVSPALVTIILSELDTFPALKDSAAYLAVRIVMSPEDTNFKEKVNYALIELPEGIDRFVPLPEENGQKYIILLDDLIRHCFDIIFSIFDYESITAHMIKITRDA
ncbi:MAG: polyphosphate kinase 1, partial [Bacteroidetes bacterium]|nr:polyphosphate kinase 1 [Bacteroidota bacterium]